MGFVGGKVHTEISREREDGMNETFPKCHEFHVQVEGVVEAHADTLAEARMLAFYLQDQERGFVAIVDEYLGQLILGWWIDASFVSAR